jgi:hypothetical protein
MVDKGRLSVEQQCIKTLLFSTETRSVVVTQRLFRAHFRIWWSPSFKTINKLYNQFNNDGSVLERKHHWPLSACSLENTDAVRVALQRSPSISTRKAAAQLGISRRSVQRILKSDLNLYPYKITVLPKLRIMRYHSTMFGFLMRHTSAWMVWLINKVCNLGHQRTRVWFMRRCIMHQQLQCGSPCRGLLGPIFCEETVNSEYYLSVLQNIFEHHLLATDLL